MLVPEISLTPQTVDRFIARFGQDNIAVLHSKLSVGERYDQWYKIKSGKAKIIIGARSAIFAPVNDLGIIIIDEEHDSSYKSEMSPRYNVKDVARYLGKKYDIPIYTNIETLEAMPDQKNKIQPKNVNIFDFSNDFFIGDLQIHPFPIPHDAANPCAFNIFHNDKKISIATDIGHMTPEILKTLEKSCFLLLESNYDPNILKCSPYPYHLKQRISGPLGHLSNDNASQTVSHLINSGLQKVVLGHLSRENNFPELAYKTVMDEIIQNNIPEKSIQLSVATRFNHTPLIDVG